MLYDKGKIHSQIYCLMMAQVKALVKLVKGAINWENRDVIDD